MADALVALGADIDAAGVAVRDLKAAKADKSAIDAGVAKLLDLKKKYKEMNGGVDFGPPPAAKKEKEKKVVVPQVSTKEGPTKKELNKLKRKEGRKGNGDEGEKASAATTTSSTSVTTSNVIAAIGEITLYVNSASPGDFCKIIANMVGSTLKIESSDASNEPMLIYGGIGSISGDTSIARYLVRSAGNKFESLYNNNDAWSCSQVDQWLHLYDRSTGVNGDDIGLLRLLESHLADKTFIVGQNFTLADAALVMLARKKRGAINPRVNIERWFSNANTLLPMAATAENKTNKNTSNDNKNNNSNANKTENFGGACPPLDGAIDGQVCTRFPPEPSGYLHIGHAKACLLNQYYAQRYKGKLLVRFDDTNPSKEKEEYEENIIKDLATLKVFPHQVCITMSCFLFYFSIKYIYIYIVFNNFWDDDDVF